MAPFARYSLAKTSRKERKLGRRLRRAYLPSCSRADACGCARVTAAGVNTTEHFTVAELVGRNARDLAHGDPKKHYTLTFRLLALMSVLAVVASGSRDNIKGSPKCQDAGC